MSFTFGRTFIGKLLLATGLLGLAVTGVNATPVTYVLSGVTFSDGGTASGSFTFDAATNTYSNINITTTAGTSHAGSVYSVICPGCPAPTPTEVSLLTSTVFSANQSFLQLDFQRALGLGASSAGVSFISEANCASADGSCFAINGVTLRFVAGGQVAAQVGFQIRYTSNLINGGDGVVNITNTGASATALLTPGQIVGGVNQNNINGNVCVNIYTFAADEQEVACCSCLVTPNALWSASVKTALLNSTLTPSFPNEVVIKLISTVPTVGTGGAQTCNPATVGTATSALTDGLLAWGTTTHGVPTASGPAFSIAETPFIQGTLTEAELARDVQECQFIQILGSGQFGICKGCSNVGLGASAE